MNKNIQNVDNFESIETTISTKVWTSTVRELSSKECLGRNDATGVLYRGKKSSTKRSFPCVRWDSLNLWNKFHPAKNSEHDLVENYCRNPDGDVRGPWCFVSLEPKKFQYCTIPQCKRGEYEGNNSSATEETQQQPGQQQQTARTPRQHGPTPTTVVLANTATSDFPTTTSTSTTTSATRITTR